MKKLLIIIVIITAAYVFFSKKQQFIQPQTLTHVLQQLPQQQQKISLAKTAGYLSSSQGSGVQQQILGIQQQVSKLKNSDIASAPPQIQQILKQIQSLPQGSINQIKMQCINICNRL